MHKRFSFYLQLDTSLFRIRLPHTLPIAVRTLAGLRFCASVHSSLTIKALDRGKIDARHPSKNKRLI